MKYFSIALLACVSLMLTHSVFATAYNYTYNVASNTPGQSVSLHSGYGTGLTDSFFLYVNTAGSYDVSIGGISHQGVPTSAAPSVRRSYYTAVTAGQILDVSGTVVANLNSASLQASPYGGIGTVLYSKGLVLLPGTYQVNIATSCNTLCPYFQNFYTFNVDPTGLSTGALVTTPSLPVAVKDQPYNFAINIANPTAGFVYVDSGILPPGLGYSTNAIGYGGVSIDRMLTGTPTFSGNYEIIISTMTGGRLNIAVLPLTVE